VKCWRCTTSHYSPCRWRAFLFCVAAQDMLEASDSFLRQETLRHAGGRKAIGTPRGSFRSPEAYSWRSTSRAVSRESVDFHVE
jgi:hypothetical protein